MSALRFDVRTFDDLSTTELYELLALRARVFVVEQDCAYLDLDGMDQESVHLLGWEDGRLLAYARWFTAGADRHRPSPPGTIALGRIVTATDMRGRGLGHAAVAESLRRIDDPEPRGVVIHAQSHLEQFYAEHGFVTEGDTFPEDDIPHLFMRRLATAPGRPALHNTH